MKQKLYFLSVIGQFLVFLFTANTAQAANSQFLSSANVVFSINNIINLTNPGFVSEDELAIVSFFEQDSNSTAFLSGDAVISAENSPISGESMSLLPGSIFSKTFSVNAGVNNGAVDSNHLGYFGLALINSPESLDEYQIDFELSYSLSSYANGQYADTGVTIEYFSEEDNLFYGSDYITHSSIFGTPGISANNTSSFSIVLTPGSAAFYLADVVITGNLTAAPVPLPAAAWLFLSGLFGVPVTGKFKKKIGNC